MRRKIKFHPDALHHIYTISDDGCLIFYNAFDYTVFFTVMSACARRYHIVIEEVCLMRNHVHLGLYSSDIKNISRFMMTLLSTYVREYNSRPGVIRIRFKKGKGRADKISEKDKRSCIIYIANNGVEKKACNRAMEYRWNFLRYYGNPNPYSTPIVVRQLSPQMKKAMSIVDTAFRQGYHIRYSFFEAMMPVLKKEERRQIVDYIIRKYNIIDYGRMLEHFKDMLSFILAAESSTGKEYDVGEEFVYEDYKYYNLMEDIARSRKLFLAAGQLSISPDLRKEFIREYLERGGHPGIELSRFLHCFSK